MNAGKLIKCQITLDITTSSSKFSGNWNETWVEYGVAPGLTL